MPLELLNSKFRTLKLASKLENIRKLANTSIQSLLFPKDKYSVESAKAWAKKYGFKNAKIAVNDNFIRMRQKEPGRFKSFRTFTLGEDVKAIIASNSSSNFAGQITLNKVSKFSEVSEIKSDLDMKIPMKVDMWFICEGNNRDGFIKQDELSSSLQGWANIPIIDFHDLTDFKNTTAHSVCDRKGFLLNNPQLKVKNGKQWVKNEALITDRYLAYLIYLADKNNKPLEISPEYGYSSLWEDGVKYQVGLDPRVISIVETGHLKGNLLSIADENLS